MTCCLYYYYKPSVKLAWILECNKNKPSKLQVKMIL